MTVVAPSIIFPPVVLPTIFVLGRGGSGEESRKESRAHGGLVLVAITIPSVVIPAILVPAVGFVVALVAIAAPTRGSSFRRLGGEECRAHRRTPGGLVLVAITIPSVVIPAILVPAVGFVVALVAIAAPTRGSSFRRLGGEECRAHRRTPGGLVLVAITIPSVVLAANPHFLSGKISLRHLFQGTTFPVIGIATLGEAAIGVIIPNLEVSESHIFTLCVAFIHGEAHIIAVGIPSIIAPAICLVGLPVVGLVAIALPSVVIPLRRLGGEECRTHGGLVLVPISLPAILLPSIRLVPVAIPSIVFPIIIVVAPNPNLNSWKVLICLILVRPAFPPVCPVVLHEASVMMERIDVILRVLDSQFLACLVALRLGEAGLGGDFNVAAVAELATDGRCRSACQLEGASFACD